MNTFVELNQVSLSFSGQMIFNSINLSLKKNSSYALIGKSGSGKSSLLNMIAGYLKSDKGDIYINGSLVNHPRRETAFLFQELGLFPWQKVKEAIEMPFKIKGLTEEDKVTIKDMIKEMGLEDHQEKYPKDLSGGERQRVALARTLIEKPDLLLMDEPTSSLDAMTKEEIQNLILKEHRKNQGTLLFVTHDIEEAMILGENILIITDVGTINIFENPYYAIKNPKEQIGFYDDCIKIRKLLNIEVKV